MRFIKTLIAVIATFAITTLAFAESSVNWYVINNTPTRQALYFRLLDSHPHGELRFCNKGETEFVWGGYQSAGHPQIMCVLVLGTDHNVKGTQAVLIMNHKKKTICHVTFSFKSKKGEEEVDTRKLTIDNDPNAGPRCSKQYVVCNHNSICKVGIDVR